jgi:hypothetical protein
MTIPPAMGVGALATEAADAAGAAEAGAALAVQKPPPVDPASAG